MYAEKFSKDLQWIHDRIINVYKESENVDFLVKLREIIKTMKEQEESFEKFMNFVVNEYKFSSTYEKVNDSQITKPEPPCTK